MVTAHP